MDVLRLLHTTDPGRLTAGLRVLAAHELAGEITRRDRSGSLLADTCQAILTGAFLVVRGWIVTSEELLGVLAAVGHAQRLRILAELAKGRVHVSELARRLGLSRPLLYLHLDRLEKAGLVAGALELSADGKAMKYLELVPFEVRLTIDVIVAAVKNDQTT